MHYVWPDELRGIRDQQGDRRGGLIDIVGVQGLGKSSPLQAMSRSRIEQDDTQDAHDPEAKGPMPSYQHGVLPFKEAAMLTNTSAY